MLVLTRKHDEEVYLDGNIRIRILSVRGNTVRIGIDAPSDVKIRRGELVVSQDVLPISHHANQSITENDALVANG